MKKKILYIDKDGVTCNFDKKFNELAPDLYLGEGDDYDARSKMVDEVLLANPTFFEDLEPIEGAIEAIIKLNEIYEIYFLSTPVYADPNSYKGKRIWLEKHFGELGKKKLILTHRKDLCIGDYLIDDRTRNGAGEFKGEHIHFGTKKFPDWQSVLDYLIPIKSNFKEYDFLRHDAYKKVIKKYINSSETYFYEFKKVDEKEIAYELVRKINYLSVRVNAQSWYEDDFFYKTGDGANSIIISKNNIEKYLTLYEYYKPAIPAYIEGYTDIAETGFNKMGKIREVNPYQVYTHINCSDKVIYIFNSRFPGCGCSLYIS